MFGLEYFRIPKCKEKIAFLKFTMKHFYGDNVYADRSTAPLTLNFGLYYGVKKKHVFRIIRVDHAAYSGPSHEAPSEPREIT